MKVHKVFPPFFNGVTEQSPELALDNQCKEMVNCLPDVVSGITKRPPAYYVRSRTDLVGANIFHTYDRGEDNEEYIFLETGIYDNPIRVFNSSGTEMDIGISSENLTLVKDYIANGGLKALTVQDRTWLFSKNATVDIDYTETSALDADYDKVAYYWIKSASGDRYNPYNYAVYLDNVTYACNPIKEDPAEADATGASFEDADFSANYLADKINNPNNIYKYFIKELRVDSGTGSIVRQIGTNLTISSVDEAEDSFSITSWSYDVNTGYITVNYSCSNFRPDVNIKVLFTYASGQGFVAEAIGSILKIYKQDGSDFEFSSWDSWGNQASEGWKGSVNKITDLPKDFPFGEVYTQIKGDENNTFTDYYVKWNGSSWEECPDPTTNRGKLANMPLKIDRVDIVSGVAEFVIDVIDWSEPSVGNIDNNPDPSFVGTNITDLFFHKNRLGIASPDSVVMSENALYTNFYIKTVLDVLDTDPIDVTVASSQASKLHYVKPFNNSLYVFSSSTQYELTYEGALSPNTVALNVATNYPMDINVEPIVVNNSLYFISKSGERQQLREYIKTENLSVKGVDLNIGTPTYLEDPITTLLADGLLGLVLCCTANNKIYVYKYTEDGTNRIQSAWSTWELFEDIDYIEDSFEYFILGTALGITYKRTIGVDEVYSYHIMNLSISPNTKILPGRVDTTRGPDSQWIPIEVPYESRVVLPDYYPKVTSIGNSLDRIQIKRIKIEGEGTFDGDVYYKPYNKTYTKSKNYSLKDLDLYIPAKVGDVEVTIKDSSDDNFKITSIVLEGLFRQSSREIK